MQINILAYRHIGEWWRSNASHFIARTARHHNLCKAQTSLRQSRNITATQHHLPQANITQRLAAALAVAELAETACLLPRAWRGGGPADLADPVAPLLGVVPQGAHYRQRRQVFYQRRT